jgi:hypothetical protein
MSVTVVAPDEALAEALVVDMQGAVHRSPDLLPK